ncbi:MAG: efflux RND transporter periplasmic adaptor subunit [Gemmatimonadales bacterium]|nr:efflux RND transporter periplasmic adaptor subunit [Gemmatimonadales bacterium]
MSFRKGGLVIIPLVFWAALVTSGCDGKKTEQPLDSHAHADGTVNYSEPKEDPGCSGEDGHDHPEPVPCLEVDHDGEAQVVHLDAKASANLNLVTSKIELETWFDKIKIPGTVGVDPDRMAHVSLPAKVRVLELNAPLHSTVKAGQQLCVLELVDSELNQMQIRAVELRAELLASQTGLDRARTYLASLPVANGNGNSHERSRVEADLAVAEAESRSLQSSLNAVLETLQISGLSRDQLGKLAEDGLVTTRISVFAPELPGAPDLEVAVRAIDIGETIPAGTTLFELVAMDRLLVIGDAFESDLPVVSRAARENLPVSLLFPAENKHVNKLSILTVESALDGPERITHFLVPVPNKVVSVKVVDGIKYCDWELRAGSQVQIMVGTQEVGPRFVVPSSAIVRDGGRICVFKKINDGYQRMDIRMERLEGRSAVLTQDCGLTAGEQIITSGALQLNLIMKQQSGEAVADDDHGHSH